MTKLTKSRRETLECCPDWSASFEIVFRRNGRSGDIVSLTGTEQALGWLRNRGLVEVHPGNGTYRQTDAGRAALSPEGH